MPYCDNCDSFVTERWKRVMGKEDGTIIACINCEGKTIDLNEVWNRNFQED